MKHSFIATATLLTTLGFLSGCPGESGFKTTDQEFMHELRIALKKANIPFHEDEEGFVRYSYKDGAAVGKIRESLEKELHSGMLVKYEDAEATQYFREMLASRGMKSRVEKRADGEWTRWYPQNEEQQKEISRNVVEHMFQVKKTRLSIKCEKDTSLGRIPPDAREESVSPC
jgi:hypothetical protein